jgi:hypothetical protein
LDNSLVWFASDCADGKAHTHVDMPFIIAGRAGGALQTGRYVQFAGSPYHNRLLLTFANLMGQPALTTFGLADNCTGGPLTF